ncbi:hypothetical protein [Streptomyces specialis]|uniref:hypothetical protein n=1 Tax=Streptomyces specialis TaxID=498367 RepID=UPI00131DB326|nr:hypothetical protein [Streptomyces specialis]
MYHWHDKDWDAAESAWAFWVRKILQAAEMEQYTAVDALRRAETIALNTLGIAVRVPGTRRCPHCERTYQPDPARSGSRDVL